MKYLTCLFLLTSCATGKHTVSFVDTRDQAVGSAHVCLVQADKVLECLSLERFLTLVEERKATRRSAVEEM